VLDQVAIDRGLEIDERVEGTALDALPGNFREEVFDSVQP